MSFAAGFASTFVPLVNDAIDSRIERNEKQADIAWKTFLENKTLREKKQAEAARRLQQAEYVRKTAGLPRDATTTIYEALEVGGYKPDELIDGLSTGAFSLGQLSGESGASVSPASVGKGFEVLSGTRAEYKPTPGMLNISLDFNASPSGDARGTEVIIPDDASPEVRSAAERFNQRVAEFAQKNGIANYPVRGVRTRSENGRGVPHTVHAEPFFNTDLAMQQAIKDNPEEFAAIYMDAFGSLPNGRMIAPHGVGQDRGAASDIFGDETSFGQFITQTAANLSDINGTSVSTQSSSTSTDSQMSSIFAGNGAAQEIFNERVAAAGYDPEDVSFSDTYEDPMLNQEPGYRLSVAGEPFDISKFEKAETREEFDRLMSVYGPDMTEAEKERLETYGESLPLESDVISDDVKKYTTAGYPKEVAEKLALGTLQIVKDEVTKKMFVVDIGTGKAYNPVDLMNKGTGEATDGVSTEGEETSDALEINVPDDYDISEAPPEAVEIVNLSPEQRAAEIASLESDLQDLGDGSVEGFEATLRTIDLGAALGLRGMFGGLANKAAGAIGADSPRPKTRTSAAALERLQRLSALTLSQAQTNQRGSVYLLNMLQANDISPNEFIGVEGALEKFKANYSLISDRVRDLEQIGSGEAKVKPEAVSRANAVLPGLKRLQSYYGALVLNAQDRVSERVNGEDERPLILATPDDGSDPKRIPDGAVDMLLNGVKDESTREEFMGAFDRKFGAGKAQEVLDAYK